MVSEKEFTEYGAFAVGAKHLEGNGCDFSKSFGPDASPLRLVTFFSEISLRNLLPVICNALQAGPGQTSSNKPVNCRCTTASFTLRPEPTGSPSGSLRLSCVVPTYPRVPAFYDVSVPFGQSAPTSAQSFAAGFLSLRQAAPTDPPSQERTCL